jgi:hypothetical protein
MSLLMKPLSQHVLNLGQKKKKKKKKKKKHQRRHRAAWGMYVFFQLLRYYNFYLEIYLRLFSIYPLVSAIFHRLPYL